MFLYRSSFRFGHRRQIFNETQLILAAVTAEFYLIHRLPDEMEAEAAGAEVVEIASTELFSVDGLA